jgi:hypothetical protein
MRIHLVPLEAGLQEKPLTALKVGRTPHGFKPDHTETAVRALAHPAIQYAGFHKCFYFFTLILGPTQL